MHYKEKLYYCDAYPDGIKPVAYANSQCSRAIDIKTYQKAYQFAKRRTQYGAIMIMLSNFYKECHRKSYKNIHFTKPELEIWIRDKDEELGFFSQWISSGYLREFIPVIFFKRDETSYTLQNILMDSWQGKEKKFGLLAGTKVAQVDTETGDVIRVFAKLIAATNWLRANGKESALSTGISLACDDQDKTAYGYRWRRLPK